MKKYITALITLTLFLNLGQHVFANNLLKQNDKREIKTLLKDHTKKLAKHNIEGIKEYYDKEYKNTDGFDISDIEKMLEKTYEAYNNIKYTTKINDIMVFDNLATVQATDFSRAKLYPGKTKKAEKMGILEGKSSYVVYLKKEKDGWKIISDDVLMEETSLKYGIANKINMSLLTPFYIEKGKEYDITLQMDKPDDIIALASLSREEVVYPPKEYKEKFRKYPSSGALERLVRANNNNLDEYAVASIGFSKLSVNEEATKARIEILGMAYIMKRVNMKEEKTFEKTPVKKEGEVIY